MEKIRGLLGKIFVGLSGFTLFGVFLVSILLIGVLAVCLLSIFNPALHAVYPIPLYAYGFCIFIEIACLFVFYNIRVGRRISFNEEIHLYVIHFISISLIGMFFVPIIVGFLFYGLKTGQNYELYTSADMSLLFGIGSVVCSATSLIVFNALVFSFYNIYDFAKRDTAEALYRFKYDLEREKEKNNVYQKYLERFDPEFKKVFFGKYLEKYAPFRYIMEYPFADALTISESIDGERELYKYLDVFFHSYYSPQINDNELRFLMTMEKIFESERKEKLTPISPSNAPLIISNEFCCVPDKLVPNIKESSEWVFVRKIKWEEVGFEKNEHIDNFQIVHYGEREQNVNRDEDEINDLTTEYTVKYVFIIPDSVNNFILANSIYLLCKKDEEITIVRFYDKDLNHMYKGVFSQEMLPYKFIKKIQNEKKSFLKEYKSSSKIYKWKDLW